MIPAEEPCKNTLGMNDAESGTKTLTKLGGAVETGHHS